jgi:hypothetical protein
MRMGACTGGAAGKGVTGEEAGAARPVDSPLPQQEADQRVHLAIEWRWPTSRGGGTGWRLEWRGRRGRLTCNKRLGRSCSI